MLFVLSFIYISACTTTPNKDDYQLVKSNKLKEIYIGNTVDPVTNNLDFYEEDGKEYIIYAHMNDLHFYDLDTGEEVNKIRYQVEGPDGIGHLGGFYIHNLDTIFLLNSFNMILTNNKGKVLKRVNLPNEIINNSHITIKTHISHIYNRPFNMNRKLYIPTHSMTEEVDITSKSPLEIIFDLETDSISLSLNNYPKTANLIYFSRIRNNKLMLVSFMNSNNLYLYKENNKELEIPCKSKYAPKKIKDLGTGSDLRESVMISIEMQKYSSILYDPYQKLYYRFFYPGYEVDKNQTLEYYWMMKDNLKVFSVMIIDEQFEVIGETLMPVEHYNLSTYFINKDGLHFSLHVNHPDFNPDYLQFANFKVQEK